MDQIIFSPEMLVSHLSKYFSLKHGDILFTGTPKGVGKLEIDDKIVMQLHTKESTTPLLTFHAEVSEWV